jgi:hypothetical protein
MEHTELADRLEALSRAHETFTKRARTPAARFTSFEDIKKDPEAFLLEFNDGINSLHFEGIGHQLALERDFDSLASKAGTPAVPAAGVRFWRHVANYSAWVAFEHERAYLKQYWSGRRRNPLSQCNPPGVLPVLKRMMDDKLLAVWTDCTSFLDIGDILSFNPFTRVRTFWEVKGLDDKQVVAVRPDSGPEFLRTIRKRLHEQDGQSAADRKVDRLRRQLKRTTDIDQLVKDEVGFNPFRQANVTIRDGPHKDESFARLIEEDFKKARQDGHSLNLIDDCLWVGVYYNLDPKLHMAFGGSAAAVFVPTAEDMTFEHINHTVADVITYGFSCQHPLATPCFLLDLPADVVADMVTGRAVVRFAVDWSAIGKVLEGFGERLNWGDSKKALSQPEERRPLILSRGVPEVIYDDVVTAIGAPLYIRLFSDLIRPSVWIKQVLALAEGHREKLKSAPADVSSSAP